MVNRYIKLTLGKKILAGFLVVAAIAGLNGVFSTGMIWDVTRRGSLMYTSNFTPILNLTDVVKGYQTSLAMLRDIIIDKSPQEQADHLDKLKQADDKVLKGLAAFHASNRSAEAAALYKQISEDLQLYGFFRDKIIDYAKSDRHDEAVNIMRTQAADVIERIDGTIDRIMALNNAQARASYSDNASAARTALYMNLLCLLAGVGSALAMGYFLARGITRPLRRLTDTVGSIAGGDLTTRIDNSYPADSRNEIHILSLNIDRMAATLHTVLTKIAGDSRQLSSSSCRLNQTSSSMVRMADEASAQISSVAASSSEMSLTASEIARNCSTAAANLALANNGVNESQQIMDETTRSMQRIGEHVRETAQVIDTLGQRSIQIGEITATIDEIADQTNLLALNAAIEAARAGENGRGFAVVADEVRALASRTTKATKEISAMIQAIQTETHRASSSMGHGVSEVEEGTLMVAKTGQALKAITDTIRTISGEVGQIATAAEQQSASVSGITTNIRQVTAVIGENAGGTQELAAAAASLNTMAADLQEIVARFNLDHSRQQGGGTEDSDRYAFTFSGLAAAEA
ncbi:MAG TPA: HAMP domain-containing methyl-accepting chemotaxis protein [Desulfuromonadaceae bacterium]